MDPSLQGKEIPLLLFFTVKLHRDADADRRAAGPLAPCSPRCYVSGVGNEPYLVDIVKVK
jgi:hypothetical protein